MPCVEAEAGTYTDELEDLHHAARILFAARLGRMSTGDIEAVVDQHEAECESNISLVWQS